MYVSDNAGTLPDGMFAITSLPVVGEGEFTILPFPMPGDDGVVTILPVAEEGEFSILPFPIPGDDGVFTILPFPLPGDEGVFTIQPIFDEAYFAVRPLTFDFDFSAITLGELDLSALDWTSLLPKELVSLQGFGFQSFQLTAEGVSLTLLDGSVFTLSLDNLPGVDVAQVETGRLAVDPSTLTGTLLDGFNAGWI